MLCMKSAFKGPEGHTLSLRRHPENNVFERKRLALLSLGNTFEKVCGSARDCGHVTIEK